MGTVLCCMFWCPTCGAPIRLPHQNLGQMFGDPALRTVDAPFLAFPCPSCKHFEGYSLHKDSLYKREGYEIALALPPENVRAVQLGELECKESTCRFRAPLFVQLSLTATEAERAADITAWRWEHLLCPLGHGMQVPVIHMKLR